MREVIAQGQGAAGLVELEQYSSQFAEGDWQLLEINFLVPPAASLAENVYAAIQNLGIQEPWRVWAEGSKLYIQAQKWNPFPWALAFAAIAGLLALLVVSWVYYRLAEAFGIATTWLLIGGGALVAAWWILSG